MTTRGHAAVMAAFALITSVNVNVFSARAVVRAGVEALLGGHPAIKCVRGVRATSKLTALERGSIVVFDENTLEREPDGAEHVLRLFAPIGGALVLVGLPCGRLLRYVRAGARALVADSSMSRDLVDAVSLLARGQVYISAELLNGLFDSLRGVDSSATCNGVGLDVLTTRERAVLDLLLDGLSNAEISRILSVSESTVKFHISNILRKLSARSRSQLMAQFGAGARALR